MSRYKAMFSRIYGYMRGHKGYLVVSMIFAFLGSVCNLLCPFLIGKAIDSMLGEGRVIFDTVVRYAVLIAVLYSVSGVSAFFSSYYGAKIAEKTTKSLRLDYITKLHDCPIKYLDTKATGELLSRMIMDIESVGSGVMQGISQLFSGVSTIIVTLVIMFFINPIIASAIMVLTPLSLFVTFLIAKKSQKLFAEQQKQLGEADAYIEERIGSIKLVKCFNLEDEIRCTFNKKNTSLACIMKKAHFNSALTNPSIRLINNFVYVFSGILGVLLKCTIGEIGSFLLYANQYTKPFNTVTAVITELQHAVSAAERVFEVLDSESEKSDAKNAKILTSDVQNIAFNDVFFSYVPDIPLIRHFDFSTEKGKKIAIVGPTGAGKTTIVNILMRFYDVTSGAITFDGVDIRDISKASLRNQFGMVLQDSFVFGATVYENLRYGNMSATKEEIIQASIDCYCHQFIMNMQKGYDTVIDESVNLSLGQLQLLSIARAMISKPSMLILDEATSNIDSLSELKVQEAFDKLMKDKTSFVIAHRLSTIKRADTILVMDNGNIVEQGNHEELLKKKGFYYRLYSSQYR